MIVISSFHIFLLALFCLILTVQFCLIHIMFRRVKEIADHNMSGISILMDISKNHSAFLSKISGQQYTNIRKRDEKLKRKITAIEKLCNKTLNLEEFEESMIKLSAKMVRKTDSGYSRIKETLNDIWRFQADQQIHFDKVSKTASNLLEENRKFVKKVPKHIGESNLELQRINNSLSEFRRMTYDRNVLVYEGVLEIMRSGPIAWSGNKNKIPKEYMIIGEERNEKGKKVYIIMKEQNEL